MVDGTPLGSVYCQFGFCGSLLMFCLALWRELKTQMKKRSKVQLIPRNFAEKDPIDLSGIKDSTPENPTGKTDKKDENTR